jgi:DNA-binding NtrC family response regulator
VLVGRILDDIGDAAAIDRFTQESWERLARHDWPGNVRELRNVVSVATAFSRGGQIDVARVLGEPRQHAADPESSTYQTFVHEHVDPLLRAYFASHLRAAGGNVSKTAIGVGLSRPTLRDHLKRLGISAREA